MKFGAILPHTLLFGGVKHFLELGNIFERNGIEFYIFTPEGKPATWFEYVGKIEPLSKLNEHAFDLLFISEDYFIKDLLNSNSSLKVFYHISQKSLKEVIKYSDIYIFANSSTVYNVIDRRYSIKAIKVYGGIDTKVFYPKELIKYDEPFKVLAFGRLSRGKKGIPIIVRACERLYSKGYNIKLLLFDTPIDSKSIEYYKKFKCKVPFEFILNHPVSENVRLFHKGDVYLCAERKTGWSNPSIEAMASGIPVIGTTSGTTDFLIHNQTGLVVWRNSLSFSWALKKLIEQPELRKRLVNNALIKIEEFTWEKMAFEVISFVNQKLKRSL